MEKPLWWQQPMTISALQHERREDSDKTLSEYVLKNSFNTEQLKHVLKSEGMTYFSEEKDGAALRAYLKKAKAAGLREIIYYNIHCYDKSEAQAHPEWLLRKSDGSERINYGEYAMNCMNVNGPWFAHFRKNIADLSRHEIDGIFLDGPVFPTDCCFCPTCRQSFIERFGHEIERATPSEMRRFGVGVVTEFIKQTYRIVKRINPSLVFYINNSALRPDIIGSNTREIYDYVDMLGAEGGFYLPTLLSEDLWKTSAFAKHLAAIAGNRGEKPMVNFLCHNEGLLAYYPHTATELKMIYAQSLANGQSVWAGWHDSVLKFLGDARVAAYGEMNALVLSRPDVFSTSLTCARVALMWSQATANCYASSVQGSDFTEESASADRQKGDHRRALFALVDILERNHIQFDIVDEKNVTDGELSRYEAVILPEVACMDKATAAALKDYVFHGGALLGNFDVGMYDEEGTYLGLSQLSEVFGLASLITAHGCSSLSTSLLLNDGKHPMLKKMTSDTCPAPMQSLEYRMSEGTRTVMTATYPVAARYSKFDFAATYPAVTEHVYGTGRAYYFAGNYPETTAERKILAYGELIRGLLDSVTTPTVVSDGAGLYELVLRRQDERFLLHAVNMTGAMERPISELVPLKDVNITLHLNGFGVKTTPKKVSCVRGTQLDNVCLDGMTVSFSLSELCDYEIVVIE